MRTFVPLALLFPLIAPAIHAQTPAFDAKIVNYYSKSYVMYVAMRDIMAQGPLMEKAVTEQPGAQQLGDTGEAVKKVFEDLKKEAIDKKIIKDDLRELFSGGFAMGLMPPPKPDSDDPRVLFVVPQTEQLKQFFPLVLERFKKKENKRDIEEVDVGASQKAVILKDPGTNPPPVVLSDSEYFFVATDPQVLKDALEQAKKPAESFASSPAYTRSRSMVQPESAGFMVFAIPEIAKVASASAKVPADNKAQMDKMVSFANATVALLVQVEAKKEASEILMSLLFDPTNPEFKNIQGYLPARGLKSPDSIGSDTSFYLGFLRPGDVLSKMEPGPSKQQIEGQLKSLQGLLQVNLGLQYEADIAPWWGQEMAVGVTIPPGAMPEVAVLMETTNDEGAQKAIDKAVNHLTYTKNQKFQEVKIGDVVVKQALPPQLPPGSPAPPPGAPTPALCRVPGFIVLATGTGILEKVLTSREKLRGHADFKMLGAAVNTQALALAMYFNTKFLDGLPMFNQPVNPQDPQAKNVEQLKKIKEQVGSILIGMGTSSPEILNLSLIFAAP